MDKPPENCGKFISKKYKYLTKYWRKRMFEKTKLLAATLLASFAIGCSTFSSPSIEERLAVQQEKHEESMAEMQEEWKKQEEKRREADRLEKERKALEELIAKQKAEMERDKRRQDAEDKRRDRNKRRDLRLEEFEKDYAAQEDHLYNEVYDYQLCTFDGTEEAPPWICDTGKYRDPNGAKFAFIAVGSSNQGHGTPTSHRLRTAGAQARGMLAEEVAAFVGTKYEGSTQTTSGTTDSYDYTYTESESRETIKGAYKLTHIIDPTGVVWALYAIPNDFNNVTRKKAQIMNPSMRSNETAMYQKFQHEKLKQGMANGRLAQPHLQNNQ
jgi:hypothetical protein